MAFSQPDLDAIDRAIAAGELSVRTADRSVTYRSMDELLRARETIAASLASAQRARQVPRHQLADFSDD